MNLASKLADAPHHRNPEPARWPTVAAVRRRWWAAAAASLGVLVVFCAAWVPAAARADGDPASDVLVSESLFLPADAGLSTARQAQLEAALGDSQRAGYPLRVALIASPADLGSVGELWRRPQSYAEFLGDELSLVYRGTLLVAMPNGYGLYRSAGATGNGSSGSTGAGSSGPGRGSIGAGSSGPGSGSIGAGSSGPSEAERAALNDLRAPGSDAGLGAGALRAIRRLAAAAGHPLTLGRAVSVPAAATTGGSAMLPWAVFAAGAALVALAWSASLRAQPLRWRERGKGAGA
ncbi:MAG TPA: hypothetical protein VNV42_13810 [Solirubrobacteraceae bacterium]|nr:hypothetical protein [Solirubrobacteraceae bacterium]